MATSDAVPQLLTPKELGKKLGLPTSRIYEMVERGTAPPHFRIGKKLHFATDAVFQWIRERETTAAKAVQGERSTQS